MCHTSPDKQAAMHELALIQKNIQYMKFNDVILMTSSGICPMPCFIIIIIPTFHKLANVERNYRFVYRRMCNGVSKTISTSQNFN